MATRTIEVPDLPFAGFYYPEILRDALLFFRRNADDLGLTDENELEVHIQLIRAFAFVGHLNNTRLDTVATELLIDTLTLLESLKRLLRLIGIELKSARPATVDLLLTLSETITSDVADFVPDLAEFSTDSIPRIPYEVLGGADLNRTDQVDFVYGLQVDRSGLDGIFLAATPDRFYSATAAFTIADVGAILERSNVSAIFGNNGRWRIVQINAPDQVTVVKIPGSVSPAFGNETDVEWRIMKFTANGAADVNSAGAPFFTPWVLALPNNCLYVGHEHAQWDQLSITHDTFGANILGVWEYFDSERSKFNPLSVVDNLDGTLTIDISPLSTLKDARGMVVVVEYVPTGAKEVVISSFVGGINRLTTASYLGQIAPSEDPSDYLLTADWVPLENQIDGTSNFEADGDLDFDLPQTRDRSWLLTDINLDVGNFLRYRVTAVAGPTNPILDTVDIDGNGTYLVVVGTQGETVGPKIIGSSDGTPNQEFQLPDNPFIDDTELIEVDEGGGGIFTEWVRVDSFLNSTSTSRHYTRESDAQGVATIRFGDGINGKIPTAGVDNIRSTSRIGAEEDGNVGPDTVIVNSDGTPQIAAVTNPRSASGWKQKDGGSEADIERLKRDAPAQLRTRNTGSTDGDIERLAVDEFVDRNGSSPVARATAIPEGLGPKTVKLLVVGTGGVTLTGTQIEDLETYFNGDRDARPQVKGVVSLNNQVGVFNYEPRLISIVTTVIWPNGNAESVRNALLALLTPLALEEDGTTYTWDFGGKVAISRVYTEIHLVDPTVVRVPILTINGVSESLQLGSNQLPVSTAASILVNIQQS